MTRGTFDSSWWNRVWLVAALSLAAWPVAGLTAPATAGDREFADLFNGHDLEGWVVESHADSEEHPDGRPVWSVRDGEIVCDGQGFGFLRYAAEPFADVTLRLDFQLQKPAGRRSCNSGIGLRTVAFDERRSQATRPSIRGYELQLLDDAAAPPTTHSCGAIYRYVAPREHALRPTGEWNKLEVAMIGPRIRVTLNERLIHDVDQFEVEALDDRSLGWRSRVRWSIDAQGRPGARAVVDEKGLTHCVGEPLRDQTRTDVGAAARRQRHDDAHGTDGIVGCGDEG